MAAPIFRKEDYGNGVTGYSIDAGATMLAEAQEAWERMSPEERAKLPKGRSTVSTTVHADNPEDALRRFDEYTADVERQLSDPTISWNSTAYSLKLVIPVHTCTA